MNSFNQNLKQSDYDSILLRQQSIIPEEDRLRIDLHCHDYNSNEPDELWGRILNLPETWLSTEDLLKNLRKAKCNALTITNHNNARSRWNTLDKGIDILPAAEFTCTFPEMDVKVHVLTYGFTPAQEEILNRLRRNVYKFQAYTAEWNLPTILPHPLYFYSPKNVPSMELFHKMMILFERFEVLNGQRDLNQNLLTAEWVDGVSREQIESWEKQYGLKASDYCINPYHKRMTGGSDDHMGFFAGSSGTYIHVPQLSHKLKVYKPSELALHGLLHDNIAPFGWARGGEKLSAAFLDYFFQVAMNMKDPGLFRMLLHRGSLQDKLSCATIANALFELRRHKNTMVFIKSFHTALKGVAPSPWLYLAASKKNQTFAPRNQKYRQIQKYRRRNIFESTRKITGHCFFKTESTFNRTRHQARTSYRFNCRKRCRLVCLHGNAQSFAVPVCFQTRYIMEKRKRGQASDQFGSAFLSLVSGYGSWRSHVRGAPGAQQKSRFFKSISRVHWPSTTKT